MPIWCSLLFCSRSRYNLVSVVFDFNPSLNDFAPVFPMLFPIDLMRKCVVY